MKFDIEAIQDLPTPPWRPMPSREVVKLLGVSFQSLANWRVRGTGPKPEVRGTGRGNKIYYRPDELLAWLLGGEWWEHSAAWLAERGLAVDEVCEEAVNERIAILDRLNVFP